MLYFVGVIVLLVLDQITKHYAVSQLIGKGQVDFIPNLLGFRYTENTGAAFSILREKQLLLILLTSVVIVALIGYFIKAIRTDVHMVVRISYMMIIAGAVGNLIDRVRLNYVIDFLEFRFMSFPIFNIADVCVVVGVILLAIAALFLKYEF
ncbi:MAG: signal peptidase II [Clostridiales bacterium 38-18]|nr:MAG: signal peptidase II [Clostridiales bacterium 38-18]